MILSIGIHSHIPCGLILSRKFGKNIINGGTVLNQNFKEFLQLLNDNNVRQLVVGGYAVALHGHPRYTKDIDIWIEMSPENAENIINALEQFGFGTSGLKRRRFSCSGSGYSIRLSTLSYRPYQHPFRS